MKPMLVLGLFAVWSMLIFADTSAQKWVKKAERSSNQALGPLDLEMAGEYLCEQSQTKSQTTTIYQTDRVTLNADGTSFYRETQPHRITPGHRVGTWVYSPTESLLLLKDYDYDWMTTTVEPDRDLYAFTELGPTVTNWLRCSRIEFNHAIYMPTILEKPSLDMSGQYNCIMWEYGLVWKLGTLTVDPDGTSGYEEHGSDFEPQRGIWAFKESMMKMRFNNFFISDGDVDPKTRSFSQEYYADGKLHAEALCQPITP